MSLIINEYVYKKVLFIGVGWGKMSMVGQSQLDGIFDCEMKA